MWWLDDRTKQLMEADDQPAQRAGPHARVQGGRADQAHAGAGEWHRELLSYARGI